MVFKRADVFTKGLTYVRYAPNGQSYVTVGSEGFLCRFDCSGENTTDPQKGDAVDEAYSLAFSESSRQFVISGNDGKVRIHDTASLKILKTITEYAHVSLDAQFSPDAEWVACCGADSSSTCQVRLVNLEDPRHVIAIDHPKPVKNLSYHASGMLATSCLDRTIRFYSLGTEKPNLVHSLENVCPVVGDDPETPTTLKVAWHPDGQVFGVPTRTYDVDVYVWGGSWAKCASIGTKQSAHRAPLTDLDWSPNGRYLATCAMDDDRVVVWDVHGVPVAVHQIAQPVCLAWSPHENILTVTSFEGSLHHLAPPVPTDLPVCYGRPVEFAKLLAGEDVASQPQPKKPDTDDELDDIGIDDLDRDIDDWIEDDDAAGYVDHVDHKPVKRGISFDVAAPEPKKYKPDTPPPAFQFGATPWRNERRFLCMNSVGYVWVLRQSGHNIVTVTFFDQSLREYHFSDYDQYDMATLTPDACLFAQSKSAKVMLRWHDVAKDGWTHQLGKKDGIRCVALSRSVAVVFTELGFSQTYGIHGGMALGLASYGHPVLSCAVHDSLVLVLTCQLTYTLQDTVTKQIYQKNDSVDICCGADLRAAFFSDAGDPCVTDSQGVLFVLTNWRTPLQAQWVPVFRPAPINKQLHWPLGVIDNHFHCLVLRGSTKFPTLPLQMHEELPLAVPVLGGPDGSGPNRPVVDDDDNNNDDYQFEQKLLTDHVLVGLAQSRDKDDEHSLVTQINSDRDALRKVFSWCQQGGTGVARVLDLVGQLFLTDSIEAARSIAVKWDCLDLVPGIDQVAERKLH